MRRSRKHITNPLLARLQRPILNLRFVFGLELLLEYWVRETDFATLASNEWYITPIEIRRSPGQGPRIERYDKDFITVVFCPLKQRLGYIIVLRPVQLVPSWPRAGSSGDFFDRGGGSCAEDVGDAEFGADGCEAGFRVFVENGLDANGGHEDGCFCSLPQYCEIDL
jgi:hypothetical protein